MTSANKK